MHANRNKGAIKKVEQGMMKANRIRNTFAVLAVVLTTFMITLLIRSVSKAKSSYTLTSSFRGSLCVI